MLIIAIPRSASTALMVTFSAMHCVEHIQMHSIWDRAKGYKYLHKIHNDFREINPHFIRHIKQFNKVFKNHFPPTSNNLELLKDIKKVILLRKPHDVVMSYKRAYDKKIEDKNTFRDFKGLKTEEDWINRSIELGMFGDLHKFLSMWITEKNDNNLIISYDDVVDNTVETLKKVSRHFGLHDLHNNVTLEKQRYTRD